MAFDDFEIDALPLHSVMKRCSIGFDCENSPLV